MKFKGQNGLFGTLLVCFLLSVSTASAQTALQPARELQGGSIVDMPNSALPLDTVFTDQDGKKVKLGDYFNQGKPVLLNLVYFRCPMLCTLVVNGMVDALRSIKYSTGTDFTILTVSFDPLETPPLANIKRRNYLDMYGRGGAHSGWHFLTGSEKNIRALTASVGFSYVWNAEQQAYLHESGIFVVTPDGHLSRTLYGVQFDPQVLKGSLLEAGQGGIGTPLDKVYFSCMHFDSSQGKYSLEIMNFTRVVALLITGITALTLIGFFRYEQSQQRRKLALAAHGGVGAVQHAAGIAEGAVEDGEEGSA